MIFGRISGFRLIQPIDELCAFATGFHAKF